MDHSGNAHRNGGTTAMTPSTHHVVPNRQGGWSVRKSGASRASRHFATKKAAKAFGRRVSFNQRTVLIIHHEDGTPQSSEDPKEAPPSPSDR
jgi:hypothetical protein